MDLSASDETALRRLLRPASETNVKALQELQALGSKDSTVFRVTLPVVTHHLLRPLPPTDSDKSSRSIHIHEVMVTLALELYVSGIRKYPADVFVKLLIDQHMKNLLRWMSHLFPKWAFNSERRCPESQDPNLKAILPLIHDKLLDSIPTILHKMSQFPDVLALMKEDARVGTLLAQSIILAARDKRSDVLIIGISTYNTSREKHEETRTWESAFYRFLELRPHLLAEGIVSRLRDFVKTPQNHADELYHLVPFLFRCSFGHNTLLDACLTQANIIRDLVSALRAAVQVLESSPRSTSPPQTRRKLMTTLDITFSALQLLSISFHRGGPRLVCAGLKHGLLRLLLSARKFLDTMGLNKTQVQVEIAHHSLSAVLKFVSPSVIYPPVLYQVLEDDFAHGPEPLISRSSILPEVDESIQWFHSRIKEEQLIMRNYVVKAREINSHSHSDPYKFCDNKQCPFMEDTSKLGRCTGCFSGYYCSRSCQEIVWKTGHRKECKAIIASTRGGREGFPPVFSIHEREYFNRTFTCRIQHYSSLTKGPLDKNFIVELDLTVFRVELRNPDDEEIAMDGPSETPEGPVVRMIVPTCGRLGDYVKFEIPGPRAVDINSLRGLTGQVAE